MPSVRAVGKGFRGTTALILTREAVVSGNSTILGTRDASSCEMKRLSSGMVAQLAAQLAELSHVDFLRDLHRYGVAVIDTSAAGIAFPHACIF